MTHPLAVAGILVEMHMDHQSLMAAMLHDVIEDTGITKTAIKNQFGNTVADLVDVRRHVEFGFFLAPDDGLHATHALPAELTLLAPDF